jgi:hypothetical protein
MSLAIDEPGWITLALLPDTCRVIGTGACAVTDGGGGPTGGKLEGVVGVTGTCVGVIDVVLFWVGSVVGCIHKFIGAGSKFGGGLELATGGTLLLAATGAT